MKDVAARAGVSVSTVSYVLSGDRPISGPTRSKILAAMDELQFRPNAVARALASKRSRVIALALSPHSRGLGLAELDFVRSAADAARSLDHHLVLLTEGMDSEADLAHLRGQGLVDGVVLMEVRLGDPRVDQLRRLGLAFSLIGNPGEGEAPFVDIDFDRTLGPVVDQLEGLGHRRAVFVNQGAGAHAAGYGPVVRAQRAFEDHARRVGWDFRTVFCEAHPRAGAELCRGLMEGTGRPTALVVMNDQALGGILQALAGLGLGLPEDVSVVSVLTSALEASRAVPALSSADLPSPQLARLAVENLVATLSSGPAPGTVLLPCPFNLRESTSRPKENP